MSGNKFDDGKLNYVLMPWKPIDEVVKVLMFGANKYGADNWKMVDDAKSRYLSAAYRHINAYAEGEINDSESGLKHLAHAMCCLIFILWFDLHEKN
jgi:hypothetical protein